MGIKRKLKKKMITKLQAQISKLNYELRLLNEDIERTRFKRIHLQIFYKISSIVCGYFDVDVYKVHFAFRKREVTNCKQIICYLCDRHTILSHSVIAKEMNYKQVNSIIKNCHTVEDLMNNRRYMKDIEILTELIKKEIPE